MAYVDLMGQVNFSGLAPGNYTNRGPLPVLRRSSGSYGSRSRGYESVERETFTNEKSMSRTFGSASIASSGFLLDEPKEYSAKPDDILKLESILTASFGKQTEITGVRDLPKGRKEVKEISYMQDDGTIYKVWVFKAQPKETLRELKLYYITSKAGVPTGTPIGFDPMPNADEYPYDIAILGGIVENAGDPYLNLIQRLNLSPERINAAATAVARMIAHYHVKLTECYAEFDKFGIRVPLFDFQKEADERFFAASGVDSKSEAATRLVNAFSLMNLHSRLSPVISHNDLHDRQLVTIAKRSSHGMAGHSNTEFGVIDWGEIALDSPHSDLQSFWIHHKRLVENNLALGNQTYDFIIEHLEEAYIKRAAELSSHNFLGFDKSEIRLESEIKSATWNFLEMFDPARTENRDIEEKAKRHAKALVTDLKQFRGFGERQELTLTIMGSLQHMFGEGHYLRPIFLEQF